MAKVGIIFESPSYKKIWLLCINLFWMFLTADINVSECVIWPKMSKLTKLPRTLTTRTEFKRLEPSGHEILIVMNCLCLNLNIRPKRRVHYSCRNKRMNPPLRFSETNQTMIMLMCHSCKNNFSPWWSVGAWRIAGRSRETGDDTISNTYPLHSPKQVFFNNCTVTR